MLCEKKSNFCTRVLSIFFRNINYRKLYVEVADEVLYQILLGKSFVYGSSVSVWCCNDDQAMEEEYNRSLLEKGEEKEG